MTRKTWLILAGAAVGAVVIWLVVAWLSAAVEVDAATAEIRPIREFVDERAKTRLPETYLVTMPYSARIKPIGLAEGTVVKKGDLLAQIVPADLELAVEEAAAGLEEAKASITQSGDTELEKVALRQVRAYAASMRSATEASQKQKEAARASLDYATRDFMRIERLHRTGAETDDNLELARLRRTQREVEYQQSVLTHTAMQSFQVATDLMADLVQQYIARKKLDVAVLRQREDQIDARLRRARLDLERGTMTSPVDGVVLRRAFSNERLVPAGTTLLEIGKLEDLEAEADILSSEAVNIKEDEKGAEEEGSRVEIYGPAIGKRRDGGRDYARGNVRKVYPAGFTKISSLGVEQQRVKVIVRIHPEDLKWLREERNLGVGYRVRVRIITAEKQNALVIPRSALFRGSEDGWRVYAIHNGRTQLRTGGEVHRFRVGLINDKWAEITSGLSEGEQVVLAPESNLEDGTHVRVKPKDEEKD